MLILSRKTGEAILIDGGIRIVVLASDNGGVRLGIEAPTSVGIVREEIVHRIAEENVRAGATSDDRQWLESLQPRKADTDEDSGEDGAEKA
ncbi:MAG: carbon storage regulator CsrA [Gemmatimonadota bacterium]|nr:carbon storage regulator CsrA [Gemmatimonadota bacterium]MDH5758211.1 carbon storage regulator CsrA [Gemmatimonadota bacterium]